MSTESELGVLDFHKGLRFTNVFRGTISGNTIDGEWADVPRGRFLQSGRLLLRFSYLGSTSASFVKTSQTGGFGASRWTKRIVVNSNPAACENASSANIVCKFDRVTKSNGGTLLHGGDLVPYKDNVVIFGQVTNRAKLEQEDGDFDFDMAVERVNWSATGLDQLLGGFWTKGWLPDSWTNGSPSAIRAKLDRHNNNAHVEAIRYGSTGSGGSGTGAILLPGWAQSGANSVLVNGQPVNGNVASTVLEADIGGHYLGPSSPSMRVRVMGVLVLDCGHGTDCSPPDPDQMGVEIHPVYSIDIQNEPFGAPRPGSSGTLTGAWAANDEGTYYLRQVNNSVWWLGLSRDRGGSFTNVFHGMIQGNTVAGDWADLPIGSARNSGRLTLLGAGGGASTTKFAKDTGGSTVGFGARLWEKLYDR